MSRAFTLIETIVTAALFAVLMLAVTQLYLLYERIVTFQQSAITVSLGASRIMDATRTAGLQAKRIATTHLFSGVSYSSGTTTAIFEMPAIDASGAVITNTYDYVGIHASGTVAYLFVDAAPGSTRVSETKNLSEVLNGLSFVYDNTSFPSVTNFVVSATTSAVVRGETTQTHMREHVYLRNI